MKVTLSNVDLKVDSKTPLHGAPDDLKEKSDYIRQWLAENDNKNDVGAKRLYSDLKNCVHGNIKQMYALHLKKISTTREFAQSEFISIHAGIIANVWLDGIRSIQYTIDSHSPNEIYKSHLLRIRDALLYTIIDHLVENVASQFLQLNVKYNKEILKCELSKGILDNVRRSVFHAPEDDLWKKPAVSSSQMKHQLSYLMSIGYSLSEMNLRSQLHLAKFIDSHSRDFYQISFCEGDMDCDILLGQHIFSKTYLDDFDMFIYTSGVLSGIGTCLHKNCIIHTLGMNESQLESLPIVEFLSVLKNTGVYAEIDYKTMSYDCFKKLSRELQLSLHPDKKQRYTYVRYTGEIASGDADQLSIAMANIKAVTDFYNKYSDQWQQFVIIAKHYHEYCMGDDPMQVYTNILRDLSEPSYVDYYDRVAVELYKAEKKADDEASEITIDQRRELAQNMYPLLLMDSTITSNVDMGSSILISMGICMVWLLMVVEFAVLTMLILTIFLLSILAWYSIITYISPIKLSLNAIKSCAMICTVLTMATSLYIYIEWETISSYLTDIKNQLVGMLTSVVSFMCFGVHFSEWSVFANAINFCSYVCQLCQPSLVWTYSIVKYVIDSLRVSNIERLQNEMITNNDKMVFQLTNILCKSVFFPIVFIVHISVVNFCIFMLDTLPALLNTSMKDTGTALAHHIDATGGISKAAVMLLYTQCVLQPWKSMINKIDKSEFLEQCSTYIDMTIKRFSEGLSTWAGWCQGCFQGWSLHSADMDLERDSASIGSARGSVTHEAESPSHLCTDDAYQEQHFVAGNA